MDLELDIIDGLKLRGVAASTFNLTDNPTCQITYAAFEFAFSYMAFSFNIFSPIFMCRRCGFPVRGCFSPPLF